MTNVVLNFLGRLENDEAILLSWGLVDGFWAEQELIENADRCLTELDAWNEFPDGRALIARMETEHLLIRWDAAGGCRYRTRMSESLRLLARLRQLFPKHFQSPSAWMVAPALVSDFRFLPRPRFYPCREVDPGPFIDTLGSGWSAGSLTRLQQAVTRALLGITETNAEGTKLAGFQARATERILQCARVSALSRTNSIQDLTATVICSGTGSGKTLAFYVPALAHLAGMLENNQEHWTRALAIYPRNELLKDQFTEVCAWLRKVNPALRQAHRRGLRIGAFFGDTPKDAAHFDVEGGRRPNWVRQGGGWICPFLRCTTDHCDGRLVWLDSDRQSGRERLTCDRCNTLIDEDIVVLSRRRLAQEPPDILFTSTEMLSQRMTDSRSWHLFGIGRRAAADRKPAFVLLDEAHTYMGPHGAQVAGLLRRWRHRANCAPHFVGLSATLLEADAFFAQLTGVPEARVEEISPESGEMLEEGREYLAAVRGDPASGVSLLSTTIQTAMLWRRVLDANPVGVLGEANAAPRLFGRKVFVFTDDLDVTNRLYFDLVDAEGMNSRGQPDRQRHPQGSLATLRRGDLPERERRWAYAQWWRLCEEIGHSLRVGQTLRVGRVSSQDSGVDADAEIIVATAALEVGFNDPDVGAVIQHKAPREAASFLQRKGRAGRRRDMRPWTLAVLSDFGRDRLAYQGYDVLFDPELLPQELPVANRHIRKMQAVYACLDWLADQLATGPEGHLWADASAPAKGTLRSRQENGARLLSDVLAGGIALEKLSDWLRRALLLSSPEEVESVLWDSPRALMTSVLPTLLRRWESGWQSGTTPGQENYTFYHPLPEFIPANLFSDLNLPEVTVWAVLNPHGEAEAFPLPVAQALREFAPGRISRRFGIRHRLSRHWIPVDPSGPAEQVVLVDPYCAPSDREELGSFPVRSSIGNVEMVRVLRPLTLMARHDAPPNVQDSSNALPDWRTHLAAPRGGPDVGIAVDLPLRSSWRNLLEEIRFYSHRQNQPAQVTRFALGSTANIRLEDGQSFEISTRFGLQAGQPEQTEPVALGFSFEADAFRVRVRIPQDWRLVGPGIHPAKIRALRMARFHWRMDTDPRLRSHANVFQRQLLAEIALAAVTAVALEANLTLEAAWTDLRGNRASMRIADVLQVIFQSLPATESNANPEDRLEQRRVSEVREMLGEADVLSAIDDAATELWRTPGEDWDPWLQAKFLATLGAAFRDAVQQVCPQEDVSTDLLVDLDGGPSDVKPTGLADIWLTETSPGGGGLLEHLLPRLTEDPSRFLDLVEGSLGPSDYEIADSELHRFVRWATEQDSTVPAQVAQVRNAMSQGRLANAFLTLKADLKSRGLQTNHSVMAALSGRVLRPGSSRSTDELIRNLLARWESEEERLGVEIGARVLAYALSSADSMDQALGGAAIIPWGPGQDRRQWRCNTLASLLWPRGSQARNHALTLHNPYAALPSPERWLVCDSLQRTEQVVLFSEPGWPALLNAMLQQEGRAVLAAPAAGLVPLRTALISLLATSVDTGTLMFYPRLRAVRRTPGELRLTLELTAPTLVVPPVSPDEEPANTARLIIKTAQGSRDEIRDLLESLVVAELLVPGPEIWLVSPWVSDLPLLDNRSGAYAGLEPSWPKRHLTLAELLAFALKADESTRVHVVTRSAIHNKRFCDRLQRLAVLDRTSNRLSVTSDRDELHSKGFLGTAFALNGSMNFTRNGVEVFDEMVQLETAPETLAQLRLNFQHNYATVSHP